MRPKTFTIRSMTGYGRAEGQRKGGSLAVEIRSVNHRYCDLSVKLPKGLFPFEEAVKKQLKQRIERGHVDLAVYWTSPSQDSYTLDLDAAQCHYQRLEQLREDLGLEGEVTLDQVIRFKDFIVPVESAPLRTTALLLKKVLDQAITALDTMRLREGRALASDITARIEGLIQGVRQIEKQQAEGQAERYQRFCKRVEALTSQPGIDRERLAQELAVIVTREDISEEVTRLRTHLTELNRLLCEGKGSVGRKLDFLTQEIGREINTLGSKANDEKIALGVVGMKCDLEKIREQIQNIE